MKGTVITGTGPLTPAGAGRQQFWNAAVKGLSSVKEIRGFPGIHKLRGAEVDGIEPDEIINDRRFRRAAGISRYLMASTVLAMNDAGLGTLKGKDTAFLIGLTHGALNYTQEYHRALIEGEAEDVSPILFADSVLNAPAGNASICHEVHGPVHTMIGGRTVTVKSVMNACRMLHEGLVERAVVASAEELNELSFYCHSKLGEDAISEGAGAVLIEPADKRTGTEPYCLISGFCSRFNPYDRHHAFNEALAGALKMADLSLEDIDIVLTDSPGDTFPGIQSGSIIPLIGNAFAVTAIWHIILGALIIKKGKVPPGILTGMERSNDTFNKTDHLLVCASEREGNASMVILSRYRYRNDI